MSTEGEPPETPAARSSVTAREGVSAGASPTTTASFQVSMPEPFTFSRPEEWVRWIRRFERFRVASGLTQKDGEVQVSTLIYAMGDQADDILRSFTLSDNDRKSYAIVKSKFDNHFIRRRNVIFERAKFNRRRQEESEPVETFITALYALAEHCGYGDLHDEMIRDRIVVGIRNNALSEKMQLDSELTLSKAIAQVRQSEAVKQQQPLLRGQHDAPVGAVKRGRGGPNKGNKPNTDNTGTAHKQRCTRCGRNPTHNRAVCPARDKTCDNCGKKGHFKAVCRSKAGVGGVDTTPEKTDSAFMGTVNGVDTKDNPWAVDLTLQGKPTTLHIDTGAEVTVISEKLWRSIGRPELMAPDRTLRGPDSHVLPTLGKFLGTFQRGERQAEADIYVVQRLTNSLLGRPTIRDLDLLKIVAVVDTSPKDQYPSLFQGLGKLEGDYQIELRDDAQPFAQATPRRVAIPLLKNVQLELNRMEKIGVITKVNQPTEWCAGMVVVPKANGRVRICVDLTKLNESVKRERHPLPVVDQTLAQLAGAKLFTKLDANSGFWQIPLDPASSLLTTFITPFGRYRFNRLPFGISSAPEHFQRRMSEALAGLAGTVCMMDDILIHGASREEHDQRLETVLQRLANLGMTLNAEKCTFAQTSVKFLGHVIDGQGIRPDPDRVDAVVRFTTPTCVGDVRRFLGMVNQLSKFSPNLADHTQPLRELLLKDRTWAWEDAQQQAFQRVKQMLVASPVLALFDPNLETIISADASSYGLGAVLLQKQATGHLQPVAYISRSMTPTERRYAQIEKEALAFTWACERLCEYLVGLQFHIQTDHKPLVPLFSTKHLEELPVRVQRFRMRMMRYNFTISHVPGQELTIADTLSRAPVSTASVADQSFQSETTAYVNLVVETLPATEKRLKEIKEHQEKDTVCQKLVEYCKSGWPEKRLLSAELKKYFPVSAQISIAHGLLLRGSRIIIPSPLRKEMLKKIHSSHQGITKCRERARQSVWWPGLSTQLNELVQECSECLRTQRQRPQPLKPTPLPQLPWQKVATDLFEWKQGTYLLVVDYFSRYIEIARLNRTTTSEVVTHLKSIFARHGIPETLISDNGPQYTSQEFASFAADYEFEHRTSSPYFPQGNGEAERAVGTIKSLLNKSGDPYKALLAYRSTPLQIGYSPSQLLMGRILRSTVPTTRSQREPEVPDLCSVRVQDKRSKARQKRNHDAHHGARELTPLKPGDRVWIPQRQREGEVQEEVAPRSYTVESGGDAIRRNRRDLIRLPDSEQVTTHSGVGEQIDAEPGEQAQPNNEHTDDPDDNTPIDSNDKNTANDPTETPRSNVRFSVRRSGRHSGPPDRFDPSWTG